MSADHLVEQLVRDLKPVRRRSIAGDASILGVVLIAELVAFLTFGDFRPDISHAMAMPSFWWKLVSLGMIAALGGVVALLSLHPAASPRRGLRWLAALIVLAIAAGWAVDAGRNGLSAVATRLDWRDGLDCVTTVVLLSIPPVIGLGVLMRRGAPTDGAGTAVSAGIAAAAWGAFVFVFSCTYDDPLYIAVWYSVACGIVTAIARLVLPPLTRW